MQRAATVGALGLLTALAFVPALANGFVASFDDGQNFLNNPHFRGLGWPQVCWAWRATLLGVYQPLAWLLFSAEFAVWGLQPWGYHLVSVLWHVVNTCLFFGLTVELLARACPDLGASDRSFGAACAAAMFAVHPLRVEVVAWISCQPNLPCAGFCLLCLHAYLRPTNERRSGRRAGWLALAWVFCLAAVLSKPAAVTLPLVLVILDVYPLRRLGSGQGFLPGAATRAVWLEKIPFFGIGATFAIVTFLERQSLRGIARPRPLTSAIAQACYSIAFYLFKTIAPFGLMPFHPAPSRIGFDDARFLLPAAGVAGLCIALFWLRRDRPGLLAAWASYLVLLAPSSGLVRTGPMLVADRYSYIASMAGFVLAAAGFASLRSWGRRRGVGLVVAVVALALVTCLIPLTWRQCRAWRDSNAPWEHSAACYAAALRAHPDWAEAHHNLGVARYRCARLDEAVAEFRTAIRHDPGFAQAWGSLGQALADAGQADAAIVALAEAVRLDPESAELRGGLAAVLVQRGRLDEAFPQYVQAIRREPANASWHIGLGLVLFRRGQLEAAAAEFSEAVRLDPDIALTLDQLRRLRGAGGWPSPAQHPL
jgi:protein O-mannosyl-transferase